MIVPPPPFSVDLFLVGSNPRPVTEIAWLAPERAGEDDAFQAALRRRLAPLMAARRPFVVVDGGDGAILAGAKPWGTMRYLSREYGDVSTTTTASGRTRTVVRTETEGTQSGGITVGRFGGARYRSGSFLHFGTDPGHPVVALMDLNSFRETRDHGQPQDKAELPDALLFSDDSAFETREILRRTGLRPSGPVLCRAGMMRRGETDVVSFPPAGVAGHYRLVRAPEGWRLAFVDFLHLAPGGA